MPRRRASPTVVAQLGDLIIERDSLRRSGRLLRQGDMDASYVDLADDGHLEFDYLRWMRIVLRTAHARRVIHIGGGAGALARALAAENPGGRQLVCEVNADVVALAREHLGLRRAPGLRVRVVEGRAFVAAQRDDSWDAVAIDAFVGARVPRSLITAQALGDVARVAPLTVINVVDDRSARDVHTIAAAVAQAYNRVSALTGRGGNTVVIGSTATLDARRIGALAAADASPARVVAGEELVRRIAATPALRDEQL